MLKPFEFLLVGLSRCFLLLPVQEGWNLSGKFFCPGSQVCHYSGIRRVAFESGSVQSQVILKLFQDEVSLSIEYLTLMPDNMIFLIVVRDFLCHQLLHTICMPLEHRFASRLLKLLY